MQKSLCQRLCCSSSATAAATAAFNTCIKTRLMFGGVAVAAPATRGLSPYRRIRSMGEGGDGGDGGGQQWYGDGGGDGGSGSQRGPIDLGERGSSSYGRERGSGRGRGGGGRGYGAPRGDRDSYRDRDSYSRGGRDRDSYNNSYRSGRGGGGRVFEARPDDWLCPECSTSNFGSRSSCRSCEAPRPEGAGPAAGGAYDNDRGDRAPRGSWGDRDRDGAGARESREVKPGDWLCSCGANNYARRIKCFRCGESAPEEVLAARPAKLAAYEASDTDWTCPECGDINFARRNWCRACDTPRPGGARNSRDRGDSRDSNRREYREPREQREYVAKEGDWACGCGEINYAFRTECRKCRAAKP